ncbi:MAG: two-component regulator propeller domain-containing protein [Ferruginibacter sp.]
MNNRTKHTILIFLPFVFFITSCNNRKQVPFPANENGFLQPVTRPFSFSAASSLTYVNRPADSLHPAKPISFELDKLPSKPFAVHDFTPFKKPIRTRSLNWDQLPDSTTNIDQASSTAFRTKKVLLSKPTIVKAGMPKLVPEATTGILQFGEEEGLAGVNVTASIIDKSGVLWFATERGLCRYIGDNIAIYTISNKTSETGHPAITDMVLDEAGNIWATTDGQGIYKIDIDHGIVSHDGSSLLGLGIICDHAGKIWVATWGDGLFIIDKEKQTIKNIRKYPARVMENSIGALLEDRDNNIWMAFFGGVPGIPFTNTIVINAARNKVKKIDLEGKQAISFFENSNGEVCVGTVDRGIHFISRKDNTIKTLDKEHGFVVRPWLMMEDGQGRTWVIGNDTACIINKEKDAVKNIIIKVPVVMRLRGSLVKDRSENIWIGTIGKGLLLINANLPAIEIRDKANGLNNSNVWGLLEDKENNIWIGTASGVHVYQPAKDILYSLTTGQKLLDNNIGRFMEDEQHNIFISTSTGFSVVNLSEKKLTNYGKEQFATVDYNPSCFLKDKSGEIWFDANMKGLVIFNREKNTVKRLTKKGGLLSDVVWDLKKDRFDNIWVGSDSGISIISPDRHTVRSLRESEGLVNNSIWKIEMMSNGEVWIGTQAGVSLISPDQKTITNLTQKEGLVPEVAYNILEADGKVYVATANGLIVVKRPGAGNKNLSWRFINYGKKQGFPNNDYNTNTGLVARDHSIWLGALPALTIITREPVIDTAMPQVYISGINIRDQLPSFTDQVALSAYLRPGDTLWDDQKDKYYLKNSLAFSSGYLQENNIRWDSVIKPFHLPAGLSLPFDQNSLSFSFTNMDINSRDKILYRYILEGKDNKWSDASPMNVTKNYYNLDPGKYSFRVSSKGLNEIWSNPEELEFTIRPPWWKTWWAYTLYVLSAGLIIVGYARYRSGRLLQANIELENKIKQRTSELSRSLKELKATQSQLIQSEKMASLGELTAGIAHEIQNPLNFINNFSEVSKELLDEMKTELDNGNIEDAKEIMADVIQNLEKINHHGKRADAIVKGMLQHSRSSSGVKEPTDINALCDEYLRLSYHGLRAKDKSFNATLKTDFDPSIGSIHIIPQDIGRVILNLLTNAFYVVDEKKRSGIENYEPVVSISTKQINGKVEIKIADNGNGIPPKVLDKIFQPFFTTKPTGQGTGLGLSLSYDIVKAYNGELKVETTEKSGTEFIILLPIIKG